MIDEVFFDVEEKMEKVVVVVCDDLLIICIGCVNFGMFFWIIIDYYGVVILIM